MFPEGSDIPNWKKMQMSEGMKGPWSTKDWSGMCAVVDECGEHIAIGVEPERGALIVRAVNSHDALMDCMKALEAVIAATQAYLPPDGIDAKECINRILAATDNPEINTAQAKARQA